MREKIIREIDKLLRLPAKKRSRFNYTYFDITQNDILFNLIELIRKVDVEGIFNNKMQFIGYLGSTTTYEEVALWLIHRSMKATSEVAVDNLMTYLRSEYFTTYFVMWLDGIFTGRILAIEENLDIRNSFHIPVESVAEKVNAYSFNPYAQIKAGSVIVNSFQHKRIHIDSEKAETFIVDNSHFENAEDIRLLLTICTNGVIGIQSTGVNKFPEDNVPNWHGVTTVFSNYRKPRYSHHITDKEIEFLKCLYTKFKTTHKKELVRNVLKRLNEFATYNDNTDKAISIRTILETLFLNDSSQGELAFQLALRISKHNGGSLEERESLFKDIKKLYNWCSRAVHNGCLNLNEKDEVEFNKILDLTIELIKKEIIRVIENNPTNWDKVVLS